MVWCETSKPDLHEAQVFAEAIHEKYPDKLLSYNCSPSFNWKQNLTDSEIVRFQFVTLAGFHSLNFAMFNLASRYKEEGMFAYSQLQEAEFANEVNGYTATKHQREVGTGYFDAVKQSIDGGKSPTLALAGSTEEAQFV